MPDQLAPRKRIAPRITSVPGKFAFAATWWVGGAAIGQLFNLLSVPDSAWVPFITSWDLAFLIVGAQIFRARGEAIESVRPWWQATGRPRASRVLGKFTAIGSALQLVAVVLTILENTRFPVDALPTLAAGALTYATASVFYFRSARMLQRTGAGAPPLDKLPRRLPAIR